MVFPLKSLIFRWLTISFLVSLVACSSPDAGPSEDSIYLFALSPSALPANQALALCAAQSFDEGTKYRIDTLFPSQMELADLDLVVHLSPEISAFPFSVKIGAENFVLITHPTNPIRALDQSELTSIFAGQISSWSEIAGTDTLIEVLLPTPSDEGRVFLLDQILNGSALSSHARLSSSPEIMLSMVSANPQAIGILPSAWVGNKVHSTVLGDTIPLLLSSPIELDGSLLNLAACLQSGAGQSLLQELYDG
jgi:hypothetical protein